MLNAQKKDLITDHVVEDVTFAFLYSASYKMLLWCQFVFRCAMINIACNEMYIIYVTLEYKTSLKSLGYISSNSQKYTAWVKICIFLLGQKSLGY